MRGEERKKRMWSGAISATSSAFIGAVEAGPPPVPKWTGSSSAARIECSSRPQKKATAHHMKTRPKKTQPWDVRRKPTVYPPLPPLPPDWILSQPEPAYASDQAPPTSE